MSRARTITALDTLAAQQMRPFAGQPSQETIELIKAMWAVEDASGLSLTDRNLLSLVRDKINALVETKHG